MNNDLKFEMDGGIAVITLNRPEAHNSITADMLRGIGDAYQRCDEDDDVRVVVLTGAGTIFCAGADMSGGGATSEHASLGSAQAGDCRLQWPCCGCGHGAGCPS